MVGIVRLIGFIVSAIGVQLASGIGAVALVLAALIGFYQMRFFWLLVPMIGGAVAAHYLFEDVATGGKVVNALSNLPFELIVYVIICLVGFGLGVFARRWRAGRRA